VKSGGKVCGYRGEDSKTRKTLLQPPKEKRPSLLEGTARRWERPSKRNPFTTHERGACFKERGDGERPEKDITSMRTSRRRWGREPGLDRILCYTMSGPVAPKSTQIEPDLDLDSRCGRGRLEKGAGKLGIYAQSL